MASSSSDLSIAVQKSKQAARLAVAAALKAIEYSSTSPAKAREAALNAATQAALAWKAAHELAKGDAKRTAHATPSTTELICKASEQADACEDAAKLVVSASAAALYSEQAKAKAKADDAQEAALEVKKKKSASVYGNQQLNQQLLDATVNAAVAATGAVAELGKLVWPEK